MPEIKLKHWIYFFCSFALFTFVLTTSGSVLYLFGGNLAWFFGLAIVFISGWVAHGLYPPEATKVQIRILEILQEISGQAEGDTELSESFQVEEFEMVPIIQYLPSTLSDCYLIVSRVGREVIYLSSMTNTDHSFTASSQEAMRFQDLYKAWIYCGTLYAKTNRSLLEVVAVNPVKEVEIYEQVS